jgi:hypothetical protein
MIATISWRHASLAFTAGAVGAIANRLTLWALGALGVSAPVHVAWPLTDGDKLWLYSAIVWGGMWGFLFLIPWPRRWWQRGLVFSLGPDLGLWLVLFPLVWHLGLFGAGLGAWGGLAVPLIANAAWGLAASWWLAIVCGETARASA